MKTDVIILALRLPLLPRQPNHHLQQHPPLLPLRGSNASNTTTRLQSSIHLQSRHQYPNTGIFPPENRRTTPCRTPRCSNHPGLGARRLPRRSKHNESRRSSLVRTQQTHLPRQRLGRVRSEEGLFQQHSKRRPGQQLLLLPLSDSFLNLKLSCDSAVASQLSARYIIASTANIIQSSG